ncbi:MAG: hypothetical protein JXR68_07270 [Bacteroidales bacterium]|nr:hypothetical protein [Bacteroidales bacterium]
MYFIKTKGTKIVPDSIQIRDENYALIEQFKFSSLEKKIIELFDKSHIKIIELIENTDFEILIKIEL